MRLIVARGLFAVVGKLLPNVAARVAVRMLCTPERRRFAPIALAGAQPIAVWWQGETLSANAWGRGSTVLLVHGWGGQSRQFRRLTERLSAQGYRVVSFDGPAHGASLRTRATFTEFVDAVSEACRQQGPLHAVVGHSFGGSAACIAATRGAAVGRIVVIAAPFSIGNVIERFVDWFGIPQATHQRIYAIMDSLQDTSCKDLSFQHFGPQLNVRGLIVHDSDDQKVPHSDGEAIARHWRDARLLVTNGLGHNRVLSDQGVVDAVVDFLAAR